MITPSYINIEMADEFEEAIKLGAEAGISTIALRSKKWVSPDEVPSGRQVDELRRILDRYEVNVSTIFSPVGKCSIDVEDEIRTHLEIFRKMVGLAKALGIDRIRVFPFCRSGYREYERSRLDEYIADEIGYLCIRQ